GDDAGSECSVVDCLSHAVSGRDGPAAQSDFDFSCGGRADFYSGCGVAPQATFWGSARRADRAGGRRESSGGTDSWGPRLTHVGQTGPLLPDVTLPPLPSPPPPWCRPLQLARRRVLRVSGLPPARPD